MCLLERFYLAVSSLTGSASSLLGESGTADDSSMIDLLVYWFHSQRLQGNGDIANPLCTLLFGLTPGVVALLSLCALQRVEVPREEVVEDDRGGGTTLQKKISCPLRHA